MIQNTLSMTQNNLFVNQMTQNTLFTAFIATEEKSKHTRLENMILGQLKIGEHQAKCRALITDALLLNHVMQGASSLIYHALGKSVYSSALFQGVGCWAFHILGAGEQFIVMDSTLPQN